MQLSKTLMLIEILSCSAINCIKRSKSNRVAGTIINEV